MLFESVLAEALSPRTVACARPAAPFSGVLEIGHLDIGLHYCSCQATERPMPAAVHKLLQSLWPIMPL